LTGNTKTFGAVLSNLGTIDLNLSTNQGLSFSGGATYTNNGLIRFSASVANALGSGTTATLANSGTIENVGSGSATVGAASFFALNNANGTLGNSSSGTLSILGQTVGYSGTTTFSGTGVSLTGGTHTFADSSVINGALNLSGAVAVFNDVTANGAINQTSSGAFTINTGKTLTLNGGMNWTGAGTISGPGTLLIPAGQTLSLTGNTKTLGAVLSNLGTIDLNLNTTQGLSFSGGATYTNNGLIRFSAGVANFLGNATTISLINNGTIENAGGGAATLGASSFMTVTNSATGLIDAKTGTLSVFNLSAATNNGELRIAPGATLSYFGNLTNAGTISGSGIFNLGASTLTNNGTIAPGIAAGDTTGTLSITGNVVFAAGGTLQMDLTDTTAGNFDVVAVSGNANYGGTLNLSGATPTGAFPLVTSATRTASSVFSAISGLSGATPVYTGTGVEPCCRVAQTT
jgi:hypothetical protein